MSPSLGTNLAEKGLLPLPILRAGIRRVLRERLRDARGGPGTEALIRTLEAGPIALNTDSANDQHYELPPEFFALVLGPRLKYSSAFWPPGVETLAQAEEAMLELTCERAGLADGQDVLELGCGWGSLTLWMAHRFPGSRITAVSNSSAQRRFIESRVPANVRVVTADINDFTPVGRFDRVVSVEMFEHMRNYDELLRRIRGWLEPGGRLFVHVFCHDRYAYPYEIDGANDWMARHFFTGGLMPSRDLLTRFDRDLVLDEIWPMDGRHYARTARAWRQNLEERREAVRDVLVGCYGPRASRWYHRWRLFFLACEELFGYRAGTEWGVTHYRFAPRVR